MLRAMLEIRAPIEQVFDCIEDEGKLKHWLEGFEGNVYAGGHKPAHLQGAKFKQRLREGGHINQYDGEITAYEKPKHFGLRIGNKQFRVQIDYRLSTIKAGTWLEYTAELRYHTLMAKILGSLFGGSTNRLSQRQIEALKRFVERGAQTTDTGVRPRWA